MIYAYCSLLCGLFIIPTISNAMASCGRMITPPPVEEQLLFIFHTSIYISSKSLIKLISHWKARRIVRSKAPSWISVKHQ